MVQSDLVYLGAFRVPQGAQGASSFDYTGLGLAYNPANNSLFISGHDNQQMTAEISIPQLVTGNNVAALNTAQIVQGFRDPVEGRRGMVNPSPYMEKISGYLVYNGKLHVTAYTYYDASGQQNKSHFVRPLNLSSTGQVQGPYKLGSSSLPARWISGYMAHIPSEWQAALGGPALSGLSGISIVSNASNGPTAAVFDPNNVGGSNAATLLVGYPLSNTLAHIYGSTEASTNPYWNRTSEVRGAVFPNGTRSVLFFGKHGTGRYCYGTGAQCSDPTSEYQGEHGYPYKQYVWAYDANDLVAVKNGQRGADSVKPYAIWTLDTPFSGGENRIGGAAWDSATRRVFVLGMKQDGSYPIVHVYRVAVGG